jgi:hypothetical protein
LIKSAVGLWTKEIILQQYCSEKAELSKRIGLKTATN